MNEDMAYTVSSDVWSLGLSVIELAMGKFPYPPETYANVFAQLTAIIHGDVPTLPDGFSDEANNFILKWYCALFFRDRETDGTSSLVKEPTQRATYAELLEHPWLVNDRRREVDMAGWVKMALVWREAEKQKQLAAELGL
jgi:mitogen-activated protein kinase kinase